VSAVESAHRTGRRIWLTWEVHRRSRSLSAAIAAELHEIAISGGRFKRYALSIARTYRLLRSASAQVVFVQSPSIVLANLATSLKATLRAPVVIDAHNGGIDPLDGRSRLLSYFAHRALRRSDLVIVTNEALAERVRALGGKPFVLTDPIPALEAPPAREVQNQSKRVVAICAWAADEPVAELIKAAALLPPDYKLSITGRPKLDRHGITAVPPNVELTGFLPEERYVELIGHADVIVDLTTRDNCLVCGAYEALALHKPLVVSDTAALRALLGKAAVYCMNQAASIAAAIAHAGTQIDKLALEARLRKGELITEWRERRTALNHELEQLTAPKY
jgi:glycosyltransferase involved in cell wall biosynthesis